MKCKQTIKELLCGRICFVHTDPDCLKLESCSEAAEEFFLVSAGKTQKVNQCVEVGSPLRARLCGGGVGSGTGLRNHNSSPSPPGERGTSHGRTEQRDTRTRNHNLLTLLLNESVPALQRFFRSSFGARQHSFRTANTLLRFHRRGPK